MKTKCPSTFSGGGNKTSLRTVGLFVYKRTHLRYFQSCLPPWSFLSYSVSEALRLSEDLLIVWNPGHAVCNSCFVIVSFVIPTLLLNTLCKEKHNNNNNNNDNNLVSVEWFSFPEFRATLALDSPLKNRLGSGATCVPYKTYPHPAWQNHSCHQFSTGHEGRTSASLNRLRRSAEVR